MRRRAAKKYVLEDAACLRAGDDRVMLLLDNLSNDLEKPGPDKDGCLDVTEAAMPYAKAKPMKAFSSLVGIVGERGASRKTVTIDMLALFSCARVTACPNASSLPSASS
jgi:hypothetical protein